MISETRSWSGKRVTVMGLGTRGGGTGVAKYLAQQGATVTVTDLREEAALTAQIDQLQGLGIRFVLGRHDREDFIGTDFVVRNPAVRRGNEWLVAAREAGVPIEMEMTIFLAASSAPAIGITGTKGKTSTSVLCGEMLRIWNPETATAGNMGISAVASLAGLRPETPVVLELSSWQLEAMDERRLGPAIAVLTNISPDHLDTYRDFADYADTKRSIARHLDATDTLILNADDPEVAKAASLTSAQVLWFGHHHDRPGIRIEDTCLISTIPGHPGTLRIPNNPSLQGAHMQSNVAAAATAALVRGAAFAHIATALEQFGGIPNRTERVATIDGVLFVNDTAATAPVAAIASLRAFAGQPIHLICGGADKQLDMTSLATEIAHLSASVTMLDGTASGTLANLIRQRAPALAIPISQSMGEAVSRAAGAAKSGDVVLLSPGCASFGLFRDEFDRGQQFRDVVLHMQRGETFS